MKNVIPFKNYRRVSKYVHASGLPRAKDITTLCNTYNIKSVYDLTKRDRPVVKRACKRNNIKYFKFSIDEDNPDIKLIIKYCKKINTKEPCLIFCYKGKHRTGVILNILLGISLNKQEFTKHKKLLKCAKKISKTYEYAPI